MKEIKYLRLSAVFLLLFVLYNNLRADEQKPAQPLNYKEKQLIEFTPAKTKIKQAKPKQAAEAKSKAVKQSKKISPAKEEKQTDSKQLPEDKVRKEERLKERTQAIKEKQAEFKQVAEEKAKQAQRLLA